jgi:hypothetical protein
MRTFVHLTCAYCGKEFDRDCARVNQKTKEGNVDFFCNFSCSAKYREEHRDKSKDNGSVKFWSRVNVLGNEECWEWKAYRNKKGYGEYSYQGHNRQASRLAWFFTHGEIPENMDICHRCDNPPCCNPNHLFLGTHEINMRDMAEKGRGAGPGLKGSQLGNAKLTEKDVLEIRRLHNIVPGRKLAEQYGVCYTTIKAIFTRKIWAHI